jgi:hypothetical protein
VGVNSDASRTAQEEAEEARLRAAREAFPGWQIRETFGGYLAFPAESTVVQAIDLDTLVRKLREAGS